MDELFRLVSLKTGIGEDQARSAVTTASDYLEQRLPEPIVSQIDNVVRGGGIMGDLPKGLGDRLGRNKPTNL